MTRIVVLADTHRASGHELPAALLEAIECADLVAHLGDFTGPNLADFLEREAPLVAVHGNNDSGEILDRYPARRDLTINGRRIALIHGHQGGTTAVRAAENVDDADIVLFGHSHRPKVLHSGERLLFNPGSPTQRRFAPYASFGVLEIGDSVEAAIVPID